MRQNQFLKKILCYTLILAMFLQPQIVVAVELSLEETQKSRTLPSEHGPYYVKHIASVAAGKDLCLELNADLKGLRHPLVLFAPKLDQPEESEQIAVLAPTEEGLVLQTTPETPPLIITQGSEPLPPLRVRSFKPVTIDVDQLSNPLVVHAAHIILSRSMQIEKELCLWTSDLSQEDDSPSQTGDQRIKAILQGSGTVTTKSLQGNGTLTLVSSQFKNSNLVHLNTLKLFTHLRNTKEGNLCAEEMLSVSGSVRNDGVFRSKINIVEEGGVIQHTSTAQVFAGLVHQVTASRYENSGHSHAGVLSQIKAANIKLGSGYKFLGQHFIAQATSSFTNHYLSHIRARYYIELANRSSLINSGQLDISYHVFPFSLFFDLSHPDAPSQLSGQEARLAKEEATDQLYGAVMRAEKKILSSGFYKFHGVQLRSDFETACQRGDVTTSASDLVLKAPRVTHIGKSTIGDTLPASLHVKSRNATIQGTLKVSGSIVTDVWSHLVLGGSITVPVFESSFAKILDFSGALKAERLRIANAERVSMLPSSVVEVDHTQMVDVDHVDMAGAYAGTDLFHKGKTLSLGGIATIDKVTAQEEDSATVSGILVGKTLAMKAGTRLDLTPESNVTLEEAAALDAPDKGIAGTLKAKDLFTMGNTLTVSDTASLTLDSLQSEDVQSVVLDARELAIQEATFQAQSLTFGKDADSADKSPFEFGSLRGEVGSFRSWMKATFLKDSSLKARQSFENHGVFTVDKHLQLDLPANPILGSIIGEGAADLTAPAFLDVEALAFGKLGVLTKTAIAVTTKQDVVIREEHVVDHAVDIEANKLVLEADQTANAGMSLKSSGGDLTVSGRTIKAKGQSVLLDAQGGSLNAEDFNSASDRLHFAASGDGNFGGATCSAPIMTSDIRGTLHTSRPDGFVPVIQAHQSSGHGWSFYYEQQTLEPKFKPARFLSYGTTQDGQTAFQHLKAGRYEGTGTKETDGSTERVKDRVTHASDGPVLIELEKGGKLSRAHVVAKGNMFSMTTKEGDLELSNVLGEASHAQLIAEQGHVRQGVDVLKHRYAGYQEGRTGGNGEYNYQTHTRGETQRVEGNVWHLDGGDEVGEDGVEIPAFHSEAGQGKTNESECVQIHAEKGKVVRRAPGGTISDKAKSITSWHSQSHHTQGPGFANNWYSHSTVTTEVGGVIHARDRVDDAETVTGVGLDSIVSRNHVVRAQNVSSRSAITDFRSQSSMNSQRSGSDMFSQGGSVSFQEDTHGRSTTPMIQLVGGHYMEIKPRPDEPGTRTLEGDVRFTAGASTFRLNLLLKPIKEFTETTSSLQMENTSSFQRPQIVSIPRFGFHNARQTMRDMTQVGSQVNEFLSLLNNLKYANYTGLALQALNLASKFTNIQSSTFEQRTHSYMSNEAAPFIDSGVTYFDDIFVEGVLAGWNMRAPKGRLKRVNARAPQFEARAESTTNQETDSFNPLSASIGHQEATVTQSQSARGSKPSLISISGNADLDISSATLEGVSLVTVQVEDKQFTQVTERIMLGGVEQEVTFMREVGKDSGFVIIPERKGKGVNIEKMSVIAAEYETRFDREMQQSSWNISLGALIITVASGGSATAIMLAALSSVSVSDKGESQHSHHKGTTPSILDAGGAPVNVKNLHIKGNVTVRPSVVVETLTQEDSPEIHTSQNSSYSHHEALATVQELAAAGTTILGLVRNAQMLADSGEKARNQRDLSKHIEEIAKREEQAESRDRSRSATAPSSSSPQDSDTAQRPRNGNPTAPRPRNGDRANPERMESARETISVLYKSAQTSEDAENFVGRASDRARSRPNVLYAQEKVQHMERNNGGSVDQGRRQNAMAFWLERFDENRQDMQHARDVTTGLGIMATGGAGLGVGALIGGGFAGLDAMAEDSLRSGSSRSTADILRHMATEAAYVYAGGRILGSALSRAGQMFQGLGRKAAVMGAGVRSGAHALTPIEALAANMPRPTNQSLVKLFDINKSGTGKLTPLLRDSAGSGAGIPKGTPGISATTPAPSMPKSALKQPSSSAQSKEVRFGDEVSAKNAALHQKHKADLELRHNTSLSEAQLKEPGKLIAGLGAKKEFKNAQKIASEYGGAPEDWVKKSSLQSFTKDGKAFEAHWVENLKTGQRLEYKTKFPKAP